MALSRRRTKAQPDPSRAKNARRQRATNAGAIGSRLDALMREVEALRRQQESETAHPASPKGLTASLFGAAGKGDSSEYDLDLEWKRFAEWHSR